MIKNLKAPEAPLKLTEVRVFLDNWGTQIIDFNKYVLFDESYEMEMRKQPGNFAYVYAVKEELDLDIKRMESRFKAWKARTRRALAKTLPTELGKKTATKEDLESALEADVQTEVQRENILKQKALSNKLGGLLTALTHKKSMLQELASHERSHISDYSMRIKSKSTDEDDAAAYERLKTNHNQGAKQ